MKTTIIDLEHCPLNERHGTYRGKNCFKEGITIDGEYWLVKYPKTHTDGEHKFHTTSPLSEYIGSHIYNILGIEAQETALGIRHGKLVVACKDFCKKEGALREFRTLKNVYDPKLPKALEENIYSGSEKQFIPLETMLIHFQYNPVLRLVPDIQVRFWEQFIVDMLIGNNDRNNSSWGILYEGEKYRPAPVFGNGAAFYAKVPDSKLSEYLDDEDMMLQSVSGCISVYTYEGRNIYGKDLVKITDECYLKTAADIIPKIISKMDKIRDFINGIPKKCGGIDVCSDIRKSFYIKSMQIKLENYLMPVYEVAKSIKKE